MHIELRDYQIDAIKKTYKAWDDGAQNVMLQLPTGSGKTVIFCHIISDLNVPTVAVAHRVEIVSQISITLARYKINHNIIATEKTIRNIVCLHMSHFNCSFYDPTSSCYVASIDSLLKLRNEDWMDKIKLVVQDEGHHALKSNKWGKAADMFVNAKGLYPTATPRRADGKGLGRSYDGISDVLIVGPNMRDLINIGYLPEYKIICSKSDIDLSNIKIASDGDYSTKGLVVACKKSKIIGDIVFHYMKYAKNLTAVVFAVSVELSEQIAKDFIKNGISASVLHAKISLIERAEIIKKFREREILVIVNVGILSEGVDRPAVQAVIMARPTLSLAYYLQAFGRLRKCNSRGSEKSILIDHVNNVITHGLPDKNHVWTLASTKDSYKTDDDMPIRSCINCFSVYERILKRCPFCGKKPEINNRGCVIKQVDGDLTELTDEMIASMKDTIKRLDESNYIPTYLSTAAKISIQKKRSYRKAAQSKLRSVISKKIAEDSCESVAYRKFYMEYGIDALSAQKLNTKDALELTKRIEKNDKNVNECM
jgi:superfamily II DNA or RNA helicase